MSVVVISLLQRARFHAGLAVIVAAACLLAASTYATFCHTWDEPEHLAAGLKFLGSGEYPYDVQHPPLARLAMAVGPYLAGARSYGEPGPSGEQEGRNILYRDGKYDLYLTLARVGMLPFLILLLWSVWAWTRHAFGEAQALAATLILAAIPPVIGHAAVAALDVPMAATTIWAMYCLVRWLAAPTLARAALCGLSAGVAMGVKLSAIPFLGVTAVAWLAAVIVDREQVSRIFVRRTFGRALVALGVAAATLILCYGGHPERIVASFGALMEHNVNGHLGYFMGELRRTGWWNFYLVALALKTPLPTLLLGLAGLSWLALRGWRERRMAIAAPALAFAAILLFASAYSHINIGVRHVMALFPLLAMGAGVAAVACWRALPNVGVRVALTALLAWQIVGVARAHPDHLAYFNELAGAHPERYLVDSDLDWGQDLTRLEQELNARQVKEFALIYRGTHDLPHENLPHYRRLWSNERATGWIAVSLFAKLTAEDGGYRWLDAYQPVMRVGKSIDLYYLPQEGSER